MTTSSSHPLRMLSVLNLRHLLSLALFVVLGLGACSSSGGGSSGGGGGGGGGNGSSGLLAGTWSIDVQLTRPNLPDVDFTADVDITIQGSAAAVTVAVPGSGPGTASLNEVQGRVQGDANGGRYDIYSTGPNSLEGTVTHTDGSGAVQHWTGTRTGNAPSRLGSIAVTALPGNSNVQMTPAFDMNVLVYTARVDSATESVRLYLSESAEGPNPTITVNGQSYGPAAEPTALALGGTTTLFAIMVTVGSESTTYVLEVTRDTAGGGGGGGSTLAGSWDVDFEVVGPGSFTASTTVDITLGQTVGTLNFSESQLGSGPVEIPIDGDRLHGTFTWRGVPNVTWNIELGDQDSLVGTMSAPEAGVTWTLTGARISGD